MDLLTTAIPFVNAAPHLGHALEYVETDILARHARARGRPVHFLTGSDEHATKNVRAAAAAGEPVDVFVARNAARFRALADSLDVSYDDFLRTGADPRHRPVVEEVWRRCLANGDLYRARYSGAYCVGCEEFRDEPCPEHDAALERVEEENWFFRLSRHAPAVRAAIAGGTLHIEPAERRNEALSLLSGDVRDLSVSRPRARIGEWGIPVPGDPDQLVYVWFDALVNYVSAIGTAAWDAAASRTHVIGKGILRFHAVIWPAILCSAALRGPDALFVHDYVTARGRKIGKSLGNTVDPGDLVERYGTDAVRWWLASEVPRVGETDFTEERLVAAVNRDLANGAGNLVQRVLALADPATPCTSGPGPGRPLAFAASLPARVDEALAVFDIRGAALAIVEAVADANRHVEATAPWTLDGVERSRVVDDLLATCALIVKELTPFVPDFAARAAVRLRSRSRGAPLVERL
jgi:methionyl-tRNA synthetase